VIDAKDGADALTLAEKYTGKIELLVTDMVMPGIGGRELAKRLTVVRPGLKVIYMSGYSEYANFRNEDFELRNVMLQKPFTRAVLASAVHTMLENGTNERRTIVSSLLVFCFIRTLTVRDDELALSRTR
jgi:DNA-binding NtrC family response regulator